MPISARSLRDRRRPVRGDAVERQRPVFHPADHDREGVRRVRHRPDGGVREDVAEGADDLQVVARRQRVHRQPHRHDAGAGQVAAADLEVVARVERPVARVPRVDGVGEHDVEFVARGEDEVAAVVDLDVYARIVQHAVIDGREA